MKNQYVCHAGVKGMKWGYRKALKTAETDYRSDVKSAKSAYKKGKKTVTSRSDRQANKLSYNRSLGDAANKFNRKIEDIATKEGGRLTEKSKGSTTAAKAKGYAKITAGVLGWVGTYAAASLIKNPTARVGAQVVSGVLAGTLAGTGLNNVASVRAYEGDTELLKRKTARGQNY